MMNFEFVFVVGSGSGGGDGGAENELFSWETNETDIYL